VVTALVRWGVRAAVVQHESPRVALLAVNESLLQHETERFATLALVRLGLSDGAWVGVVCLGGHELPLLRSTQGLLRGVGEAGSVLGVMREPELHDCPVALAPGDTLVLFTDGVPEGRRGREFYGTERIEAVVAGAATSAAALVSALLADAVEFQSGDTRDDIAIVAIRVPDAASATG
jgi:sigma-B regulation protein RsbU (phosphoserine phosphatase)